MITLRAAAATPVAFVAHQGGWDEILLVAGPIAVIVGLLLLARKRVSGEHPRSDGEHSTDH